MNPTRPSATTMFRRAIVLRCPLCGGRRTFIRKWMLRYERCRTCGVRWHREHGFELGPIALNIVFTFFLLAVSMAVAFAATAPNFPVAALTAGLMAGAVIFPVLLSPFANTLWMAFDLLSHPPDARELAEASAAVAVTVAD